MINEIKAQLLNKDLKFTGKIETNKKRKVLNVSKRQLTK